MGVAKTALLSRKAFSLDRSSRGETFLFGFGRFLLHHLPIRGTLAYGVLFRYPYNERQSLVFRHISARRLSMLCLVLNEEEGPLPKSG